MNQINWLMEVMYYILEKVSLLVGVGLQSISYVSQCANGAAHVVTTNIARLERRFIWLEVGADWTDT